LLNKKILFGSAVIPVILAIAVLTALPTEIEQKTYNYENGMFPPPDPIGIKSTPVSDLMEASQLVGYAIPEPNLPQGISVQHIGVAGDRMVVLYASPNVISGDTIDKEFMWKLQGIEIAYEKLPEYLEKGNDELLQKWANSHDAELSISSTGFSTASYENHKAQRPDGEFDKPARVLKNISEDVRISVTGFYDVEVLQTITED
jgi:hypothetical protein